MTEHVGENAELYALGVLDPQERRAVDEHLAQCRDCLRRIGEAEETVLAMDRHVASQEPPATFRVRERRISPWWYAVAAAFLIGLAPSGWFFTSTMVARQNETTHGAALLAMVHSHFGHAQFSPVQPGTPAPDAKVVFARDGSWVYVLVAERTSYGVRVGDTPIGSTHLYGSGSELFAVRPPRGERIVLTNDSGAAVARASILNQPRP